MFKKKNIPLFLLIVLISLSSCTKTYDKEKEWNNTTKEVAYRYQDPNPGSFLVNADSITYYLKASEEGKIYFSEKGENEFYLLCDKPNCSHSDQNCNAYGGLALGYYDNHLYSVICDDNTSSFDLIRMDMDGSNHQKVTSLPKQVSSDKGSSAEGGDYFFNKDYLIFAIEPLEEDVHSKQCYYRIDLETGERELLFEDYIPELKRGSWQCSISNDNLYTTLTDVKSGECTLFEGNIAKNEVTLEIEDWNSFNSIPVCFGNKLYYFKSDVGLCEYNRETNQETVMYELNYYAGFFSYTDNYIFCQVTADREFDGDWDFYVFDRAYNLINKVSLGSYLTFPLMEFVTDDAIYFSVGSHEKITQYVDLSKIDKTIEFVPIIDPYSTR